jgi:hypothetical protein
MSRYITWLKPLTLVTRPRPVCMCAGVVADVAVTAGRDCRMCTPPNTHLLGVAGLLMLWPAREAASAVPPEVGVDGCACRRVAPPCPVRSLFASPEGCVCTTWLLGLGALLRTAAPREEGYTAFGA